MEIGTQKLAKPNMIFRVFKMATEKEKLPAEKYQAMIAV
jgi:hypothetical protein